MEQNVAKTTVVCYFGKNDYLMLEQWLPHHAKLFSHGVMAYNGTGEMPLAIQYLIKQHVPGWDFLISDSIKAEFPGFTIALTPRHFILGDFNGLANISWDCQYLIREYPMVDSEEAAFTDIKFPLMPLLFNRKHGIDTEELRGALGAGFIPFQNYGDEAGIFNREPEGNSIGRNFAIFWYALSPITCDQIKLSPFKSRLVANLVDWQKHAKDLSHIIRKYQLIT